MIPPLPLPATYPRLYLSRLPWIGLFVVIGLALRLWHLSAPFWYDEVFSASLSRLPLAQLWQAAAGDVHPPLYYFLLWGVNRLIGDSEMSLRLPSVLAGLALIWVVDRMAISLGMSDKAKWLAVGLVTLSPFQVYYSQEARAYSLLMLVVSLAALALVNKRPVLLAGYSLVALYLHHLAAPFVFTLLLLAITTRRFSWPVLAGLITVIVVGYVPGTLLTLHQMANISGNYWIPPLNNPGRVIATLDDLIFFSPSSSFVISSGIITGLTLALLTFDLSRFLDDPKPFVKLMVIVPLALVTLVSLVWQPILISRVVAPVALFYYLWIADSLNQSQRRLATWLTLATPVILAILIIGPLMGQGRNDSKELYQSSFIKPGQAMYHANVGSYLIWNWYRPDVEHWLWPHNGGLSESLSQQTKEAMRLRQASFEDISCAHRQWWFVYFNNPTTSPEEIAYTQKIETDYPSERVVNLRSDSTVEAWLVKLSTDCSPQAAH